MAATSRCWTVNAVCWRSWRSNVLVHPNSFYSILTMTGNRASSFERRGATCPSHDVGGGLAQDPGDRKNALLFLAGTRELPSQCKWFGAIGQSSYCCPVSCRCSVEWVSGREFFCTETARGPRRATEKPPPSTQCRENRRRLKSFQQSRTAVSIHRCANPPRSPIQNRGPSGPEVQAQRISVVFVVLRLASVIKLKTE